MTRRQRLRRTAFTCIHTITNTACYRAGVVNKTYVREEHFWRMATANFAESAILHWCKLFADRNGKHYAWKVVSNPQKFTHELLAYLGMTQVEFDDYVVAYRKVRDKFIAHLDDEISVPFPSFDKALSAASFLLRYLAANENGENYLDGVPRFPEAIYRTTHQAARLQYTGLT